MATQNFKFVRILLMAAIAPLEVLAVSPYATQCEQVIGVPVPDVDCSDPNGSEVPVGDRDRNGLCTTPSHGLSGCNPGTKFIKFVDTFRRNGRDETVTTLIMCRKTDGDIRRPGGRNDPIYSDIGVIQYNETKHATCWFSSTADGQRPTKRVNGRLVYPSPSTERSPGFWGNHQPEANCISCHQSGVWLRTPFAMGVQPERGKGYVRSGRTGAYGPGEGNHIPDDHESAARRGLSCSVGKPEWNRPDGESAPLQVKIDATAYDQLFPPEEVPEGTFRASSGYCSSCHYIGVGAGTQTCGTFLGEFQGNRRRLLSPGAPSSSHFWMPPGIADGLTRVEYLQEYGRALDAVRWCCTNSNHPAYRQICTTRKLSGRGEERPIVEALNNRGPCALCPDCVPTAGRNEGDAGSNPGH